MRQVEICVCDIDKVDTHFRPIFRGKPMIVYKSVHIGSAIILAISHHKKLFYLFYFFTLQNIQYRWFYFNFRHNKIIYPL